MIVLQVLKIIGFVLAGIAGLAILLLLAVCFLPVRYRLSCIGANASLQAKAKAAWAAGIFCAVVSYGDKKVSCRVKLCGFTLAKAVLGEDEAKSIKEALQEADEKDDSKEYQKLSKELQKAEEKKAEQKKAADEKTRVKEEAKQEKARIKEEVRQEKERAKTEAKADKEGKTFAEKLEEKKKKASAWKEKYEKAQKIWQARATKRARKHVKAELFNLLGHIKPRKIVGTLQFGLDDPANTAIVYGNVVAFTEAISKGRLVLVPAFYEKGISADLLIKGRIFAGYVLLLAVRLYFDRDLQSVVKVIRRSMHG